MLDLWDGMCCHRAASVCRRRLHDLPTFSRHTHSSNSTLYSIELCRNHYMLASNKTNKFACINKKVCVKKSISSIWYNQLELFVLNKYQSTAHHAGRSNLILWNLQFAYPTMQKFLISILIATWQKRDLADVANLADMIAQISCLIVDVMRNVRDVTCLGGDVLAYASLRPNCRLCGWNISVSMHHTASQRRPLRLNVDPIESGLD